MQLTLGQLIDFLKDQNQNAVVENGFGEADSYRGYYDQIAFKPKNNVKVKDLLKEAKKALNNTYYGYKGGEFTMNVNTPVNIAEHGRCDFHGKDEITMDRLFDMMNVEQSDLLSLLGATSVLIKSLNLYDLSDDSHSAIANCEMIIEKINNKKKKGK